MTIAAAEIMTRDVAAARPEMRLKDVARLLLTRGISAVPVVDEDGRVLGMVSEGDLIRRDDEARGARRDWWLMLLAEGGDLHEDFLATFKNGGDTARDVMSAPVITATEDTSAREIASLLAAYRIKRVPILRDGRLVGIVSRADVLRSFAGEAAPLAAARGHAPERHGLIAGAIERLDERFLHLLREDRADAPKPAESGVDAERELNAQDFRGLESAFRRRESDRREEARRALAERHSEAVKAMIDRHVADAEWNALLHGARKAAAHGEREFLLLRFPSDLCSDSGRRINAPLPDWPSTLRGEAAEIYLRWERELKPQGFHIAARIIDFPDGKPGDAGLFLVWGE